ncbi:hypothetical protein ABTX24_17425 [Nocardioides sp. NPDC127514]|uniref:hypothetical protein n=1 Tax=unclassified Nocardioides TaxID=2615069 RepID=UPI003328771C
MHESTPEIAAISRLVLSEIAAADGARFEADWPRISLEGLSQPLMPQDGDPEEESLAPTTGARLADTLTELQRLMDEIQFSTCMAYMLLRDFTVNGPDGTSAPDFAMPEHVKALVAPYVPLTQASRLLDDLHGTLSGDRHLSRWLAGMLLDGALIKQVSVLDRLATLLELATGKPLRTQKGSGRWMAPVFSKKELDRLAGYYSAIPAWVSLCELAEDEVTVWVRDEVRGGLIHRRRLPSALAGDVVLNYSHLDSDHRYIQDEQAGLTAPEHLGVVRMAWDQILEPAVGNTALLLAHRRDVTP